MFAVRRRLAEGFYDPEVEEATILQNLRERTNP